MARNLGESFDVARLIGKGAAALPDGDLLRAAVEASRDGVAISDARLPDMPLVYVNAAFEKMTGYQRGEILGRNCRFLQGDDREQEAVQQIRDALKNGADCLVTLRNYRRDGELFHNELSLSPVADRLGRVTHFIGIQKDVTARVTREALLQDRGAELETMNRRLERLASLDSLTGLQNRRAFNLILNREWRRALRAGSPIAIYIVDIDDFKSVNDQHGHPFGDTCLRKVGGVLSRVFSRATDSVARFGGDEFVVLATGMSVDESLAQGQRVLEGVRALELQGSETPLSVSVGVCSAIVHDGLSEHDLLAAADTALYRAKNAGRNRLDSIEVLGPAPA